MYNYLCNLVQSSAPKNIATAGTAITTNGSCIPNVYEGSVCRDVLFTYQGCLTGISSGDIHVPSGRDQVMMENLAFGVLAVLQATASPKCSELALPFLCWYMFGLCDNNTKELHLPSSEVCLKITTEICVLEFREIAMRFPQVIPHCETLPNATIDCERE